MALKSALESPSGENPSRLPLFNLPATLKPEKLQDGSRKGSEIHGRHSPRRFFGFLSQWFWRRRNRIKHLIACIDAQNTIIEALGNIRNADAQAINSTAELTHEVICRLNSHLEALQAQTDRLGIHVVNLDSESRCRFGNSENLGRDIKGAVASIEDLNAKMSRLGADMMNVHNEKKGTVADLQALRRDVDSVADRLSMVGSQTNRDALTISVDEDLQQLAAHLIQLQSQTDRLGIHVVNLDNEIRPDFSRLVTFFRESERLTTEVEGLRTDIDRMSFQVYRLWAMLLAATNRLGDITKVDLPDLIPNAHSSKDCSSGPPK